MSGPKDTASATDHVEAGITTEVVAPEHPCPICGKAMKDNSSYEDRMASRSMRICSVETCRAKAEWTSGKAVLTDPGKSVSSNN